MDTNTKWWYEINGEQKGPVDDNEITKMIGYGSLKKENLIWKEGQPSWIPIATTDFNGHFKTDVPPPITGESVNNNIVWWLAFAPMLGKVLESAFIEIAHPRPNINDGLIDYWSYFYTTDFNQFWFVTIALNIWLCFQDEKKLKQAGHDTAKLGSAWLVPVYLYKRAQMLQQNNAYFWVWLVAFIVTIG